MHTIYLSRNYSYTLLYNIHARSIPHRINLHDHLGNIRRNPPQRTSTLLLRRHGQRPSKRHDIHLLCQPHPYLPSYRHLDGYWSHYRTNATREHEELLEIQGIGRTSHLLLARWTHLLLQCPTLPIPITLVLRGTLPPRWDDSLWIRRALPKC